MNAAEQPGFQRPALVGVQEAQRRRGEGRFAVAGGEDRVGVRLRVTLPLDQAGAGANRVVAAVTARLGLSLCAAESENRLYKESPLRE